MRLALFIVLLALPDCTCERQAPPAPRVAGARPANLGGGYQAAKWGTSHDDVKRIAVGKIVRDTPDEIGLGLGRGGVSFHFTNDKLTSVVYTPNFEDDARDRPLLIEALRGKFGAPTTTVQDGEELLVWSDGVTKIEVHTPQGTNRVNTEVRYLSIAKPQN